MALTKGIVNHNNYQDRVPGVRPPMASKIKIPGVKVNTSVPGVPK